MQLNTIQPAEGSVKNARRVGRGFTRGKTCGRGHKGYKSRSGSKRKPGFEGGQTPWYRRVPKFGFTAYSSLFAQSLPLSALNKCSNKVKEVKDITFDLKMLKLMGLVRKSTKKLKVYLSGEVTFPIKLVGINVTAGVKKAIEKAGGSVT